MPGIMKKKNQIKAWQLDGKNSSKNHNYAEPNIPDWFDKLESVIQSQQEPEELDPSPENTHGKWMINYLTKMHHLIIL